MASISDSYSPSPEKFVRRKAKKAFAITNSDRAASPSEDSSASGDDVGGKWTPPQLHILAPRVANDPKGVRLDALSISDSPEVKYNPPHARQGFGGHFARTVRRNATESPDCLVVTDDQDDVFISPTKTLKERRSVTVAGVQQLDVALANDHQALRSQSSNLSARHQINGVDAQNLYPPTACVFVANLPEPKDDVALEAAIYREFLKYGKCWVKIRRDSHHMPFAFVQFTSDEEAQEALEKGKGAMIHGRPCRTEMVKANRTFVIQRKTGGHITIDEAEKVLLPYGSLSKCELLHPQLRDPLGFPPTVLVEFSMFDATRDLHTAFRSDPVYSVTAFDLKKNCAATRHSGDEAFLAACERDRRSIFVGDLPSNTTQDDLDDLFSEAGEILKINLIQRPTSHMVRTMAFIEYTQPDMPEGAIAKFHGKSFHGAIIRVERKSVKDRGPTPRTSRSQMMLGHRPSEENVGVASSRGVPASPAVVSTPSRPAQSRVDMQSPAAQAPNMASMYSNWYGAAMGAPASPYTAQNYSYGAPTGGQGVPMSPMTPQATPQMPSPWSYYNNFWPNMMAAYDPSAYYMGPYAFQSPAPMMSGAVDASAGRGNEAGTGGGAHVQATPTRGSSHEIKKQEDDES